MKKRSRLVEETAVERDKNKLGDGVAWSRGPMIGKGSSGSVFLATLKKPNSRYTLYPPIMAVKSAEVSVSGSIQKETQVLNSICGCPDVIGCFGEEITSGENGQMVYNLLLEYGSGGTLAGLIKKSGGNGLPELDVRRYTRTILHGLCYIHKCGYVHCDLKPENILLVAGSKNHGGGFKAKIGDLGLAKRCNKRRAGGLGPYWRGTPMYLSPEVVIDCEQEPPSDVWALGCIVLEMLTGKPPWDSGQDYDVEEILSRIAEEDESPCIPSSISTEGRNFLKCCFLRKALSRPTAERLLDQPFVKGLVEDDKKEEEEDGIGVVKDINVKRLGLVLSYLDTPSQLSRL